MNFILLIFFTLHIYTYAFINIHAFDLTFDFNCSVIDSKWNCINDETNIFLNNDFIENIDKTITLYDIDIDEQYINCYNKTDNLFCVSKKTNDLLTHKYSNNFLKTKNEIQISFIYKKYTDHNLNKIYGKFVDFVRIIKYYLDNYKNGTIESENIVRMYCLKYINNNEFSIILEHVCKKYLNFERLLNLVINGVTDVFLNNF